MLAKASYETPVGAKRRAMEQRSVADDGHWAAAVAAAMPQSETGRGPGGGCFADSDAFPPTADSLGPETDRMQLHGAASAGAGGSGAAAASGGPPVRWRRVRELLAERTQSVEYVTLSFFENAEARLDYEAAMPQADFDAAVDAPAGARGALLARSVGGGGGHRLRRLMMMAAARVLLPCVTGRGT